MVTTIDFKITKMSPQFLVADIERSIEFYTRNLGFDIEFRYVGSPGTELEFAL